LADGSTRERWFVTRRCFLLIFYSFISSDPNEDQFAKRSAAKKERVAKNEFQRLKNIARANKVNGK
jgi:hypothetical protein